VSVVASQSRWERDSLLANNDIKILYQYFMVERVLLHKEILPNIEHIFKPKSVEFNFTQWVKVRRNLHQLWFLCSELGLHVDHQLNLKFPRAIETISVYYKTYEYLCSHKNYILVHFVVFLALSN
jgi:hypothetical protein